MSKVLPSVNEEDVTVGWVAFCPACDNYHHFDMVRWKFDGNQQEPTFEPSMLVKTGYLVKKPFPVLREKYSDRDRKDPEKIYQVDWRMLEPHEAQALRNHSQSLKRLAERGGLGILEMLAILDDSDYYKSVWYGKTEAEAEVDLKRLHQAWIEAQPYPQVCHSFLRKGCWEYLSDCTHELKGQTVPVPDIKV